MISLEEIGTRARGAEPVLRIMGTETKNRVLKKAAENLVADADAIIAANALDMEHGREKGMSKGLLDRLFLDQSRIEAMAEGLCQVSELDDPIGEVLGMKKRPNGLLIGQKRVPLGVAGIIYEARPNVTADAFALCFKTGNVVILLGKVELTFHIGLMLIGLEVHDKNGIFAVLGHRLVLRHGKKGLGAGKLGNMETVIYNSQTVFNSSLGGRTGKNIVKFAV